MKSFKQIAKLSKKSLKCIYVIYTKTGKEIIPYKNLIICFPVWLRNRLLSAGLESVLKKKKKACIASNYRQFSANIKIKLSIIRCDKYILHHLYFLLSQQIWFQSCKQINTNFRPTYFRLPLFGVFQNIYK